MTSANDESLRRFEQRLLELESEQYVLTLFVTGASDLSVRAIRNARALCDTHLVARYRLDVVDIYQHPALMSSYEVVAAPTLIREWPLPKRMLVGDLSDTARVLSILDIRTPVADSAIEPVP